MQKITPCLWFDKECEEAMNFYVETFNNAPNSKQKSKINMIKRYPEGVQEGPLAGMDGKVLTGIFELEGQTFQALDGGPIFKPTEAVALSIDCNDQAEVDHFWNSMTADGGQESQCGWLKDKYGFSWQIVPKRLGQLLSDPDKTKSDRVMQAMLGMKKLDIATLEAAAE